MNYVTFHYMYRDAHNYKQGTYVVFANDTVLEIDQIEDQIKLLLDQGEYFVPELVDLETCYFGGVYDDDHGWHEFTGVSEYGYDAGLKGDKLLSEFLSALRRENERGWEPVREIKQTEDGFEVVYQYERDEEVVDGQAS